MTVAADHWRTYERDLHAFARAVWPDLQSIAEQAAQLREQLVCNERTVRKLARTFRIPARLLLPTKATPPYKRNARRYGR
jgi:hypothetical protein